MFRVALLNDYQGVALGLADWASLAPRAEVTAFTDHVEDEDVLAERLAAFDCVMAMRERTRFPRRLLARLPRLKLIVSAAMWNVAIDIEAATELGIQVCGTGDQSTATPELTFAMILGLARQVPRELRAMREGRWQTTLGIAVEGKTLGLLGLGDLGSKVAALGRAFGMPAIAWSQNLTAARAAEVGVEPVSKPELFTRADFLSIHLKLSDRTRGLVAAADLAAMKPTAYLVNTSRGPIVDEAALIRALETGAIAGAGLDVYDREPLPADHPFRRLDNVMAMPHVGFVTGENFRVFYGDALEDIRAFLDGQILRPMNMLP